MHVQEWRRPRVVVHDAPARLWFVCKLERLREQLRQAQTADAIHALLVREAQSSAA